MRIVFLRGARRPWRWLRLTTYYFSILLVLSFICFEVLDVDGSDVPVPSKSPRIKLAESHDLRRTALASVQPWGGARAAPVDAHTPLLKPEDRDPIGPVPVPVSPRFRLTLPRAAPDDPAA
jgi:hypothetical protein